MNRTNSLLAEAFGTFWLVFGGCGTAVLAGSGVGTLGISLAFGLTVLTMAYAVGHISGGHFNPAVTLGLWAGGRFPARDVALYMVAQVVGAIVAAFLLYWMASGKPGWDLARDHLASNGVGTHSPAGYSLAAGFATEVQYRAFQTLDSYVYGYVLQEVNWPTKESDRKMLVVRLKEFLHDGRYPNLMKVIEQASWLKLAPGEKPYDADFEFGLQLILDGLERLLPR